MHARSHGVTTILGLAVLVFVLGLAASAPAAKDKIAVLIDSDFYDDVSVKFDRYVQEVEQRFPVELLVFNAHNWDSESPENIRDFLLSAYAVDAIKGALLVGDIPFAKWEQTFGTNAGVSSVFYEDMDGSFSDNDGDGMYDYHTFGPNEGPEIWVCWMRPPKWDPVLYLNRLFDKAHNYYTGVTITNKRAFIAGHQDYDANIWDTALATAPPCVDIYGAANVDTDGVGADLTWDTDIKNQLIKGRQTLTPEESEFEKLARELVIILRYLLSEHYC